MSGGALSLSETVAHRMSPRMREDTTTDDYRRAMDGQGGFGTLGYEWSDKPHRLVYDLCGEIDLLNAKIAALEGKTDASSEA
jgi:hypothetical protein